MKLDSRFREATGSRTTIGLEPATELKVPTEMSSKSSRAKFEFVEEPSHSSLPMTAIDSAPKDTVCVPEPEPLKFNLVIGLVVPPIRALGSSCQGMWKSK